MTHALRPDQSTIVQAARGLAEQARHQEGGTRPAVAFAKYVTEGFPIDVPLAAEALAAHEALDIAVLGSAGETRPLAISRRLWGGDPGRDFCQQVIDTIPAAIPAAITPPERDLTPLEHMPAAEPLAAAAPSTRPRWLTRLETELLAHDQSLRAELTRSIRLAHLTALRAATAAAGKATNRVNKPLRAALPEHGLTMDDVSAARARQAEASPHNGWSAAGNELLAALGTNLDDAIEDAMQDLTIAAREIIRDHRARTTRTLTEQLDLAQEQVEEWLTAAGFDDRNDEATALIVAGARQFTVDRVNGRQGGAVAQDPDADVDRAEGDLEQGDAIAVPATIAASAAHVVGGSPLSGLGATRNDAGTLVSAQGVQLSGSSNDGWADIAIQRARDIGAGVVGRLGEALDERLFDRETEWFYGDPATRKFPFQEHQALAGRTWNPDDPQSRFDAIGDDYPGRHHPACQCEERTTRTLRFVGAPS